MNNLVLPELIKSRKDVSWLWKNTVFLTAHGSHAYGTNLPTSDKDYRGFCIPPQEYFLGFNKRLEQVEFKGDPDIVVFNIQKFFKLAADCNPNVLEILYTDPSDHVIVAVPAEIVLYNRDLFLSKKAKHTFSGYAIAQMKKIRTHKRWTDNAPVKPPDRADYGLPETFLVPKNQLDAATAAIRKQIETWSVDLTGLDDAARIDLQNQISKMMAEQSLIDSNQWVRAAKVIGFDDNFIDLMDRERRFSAAMTEWNNYLGWVKNRNEKRSELEKKYGYDTKHGMHLVRLMRMCGEILSGKEVLVKRPDAKELLDIRNGGMTYQQLVDFAEKAETELEAMYAKSTLPNSPDVVKLDNLLVDIVSVWI